MVIKSKWLKSIHFKHFPHLISDRYDRKMPKVYKFYKFEYCYHGNLLQEADFIDSRFSENTWAWLINLFCMISAQITKYRYFFTKCVTFMKIPLCMCIFFLYNFRLLQEKTRKCSTCANLSFLDMVNMVTNHKIQTLLVHHFQNINDLD